MGMPSWAEDLRLAGFQLPEIGLWVAISGYCRELAQRRASGHFPPGDGSRRIEDFPFHAKCA